MIAIKRWALTILITMMRPASFQYPMPMYPAQIFAIPPPPPPIQVAVIPVMMTTQKPTTTTSTTTETEQNLPIVMPVAVPYPIPVPMPAQIAVPAIPQPQFCMTRDPNRPKNCPPCPPCLCMPSCTPAFFSYCSPCHLQCRCRSREDIPVPQPPVAPLPMPGPAFPMPGPGFPMPGPAFPMPMPIMPPAIILAPIPPGPAFIRRPVTSDWDTSSTKMSSETDSDSSDTSDTSSSSSSSGITRHGKRRRKLRRGKSLKHKKKFSKKRLRAARRGFGKKHELVRPVLSYISKNGDVKVHKRLSEDDAKALLKNDVKDKLRQHGFEVKYKVESKQHRSKDSKKRPSGDRRDKQTIVLRKSGLDHVLEKGSNEFSFIPSGDGKISNVSLNFNVS